MWESIDKEFTDQDATDDTLVISVPRLCSSVGSSKSNFQASPSELVLDRHIEDGSPMEKVEMARGKGGETFHYL